MLTKNDVLPEIGEKNIVNTHIILLVSLNWWVLNSCVRYNSLGCLHLDEITSLSFFSLYRKVGPYKRSSLLKHPRYRDYIFSFGSMCMVGWSRDTRHEERSMSRIKKMGTQYIHTYNCMYTISIHTSVHICILKSSWTSLSTGMCLMGS